MEKLLKAAPWLALFASIGICIASYELRMDAREHLSGTMSQCRDAITIRAIKLSLDANPLQPASYEIVSAESQNKE